MTTRTTAASAGHPLLDLARRLDRARKARRTRRHLATLDDDRLRDIGLTRADVGPAPEVPRFDRLAGEARRIRV